MPKASPDYPPEPSLTERIERLMDVMNFTRRDDMARALGYSRTALFTFEKGEAEPGNKFWNSLEALEARELGGKSKGAGAAVVEEEPGMDAVARLLEGLEFSALCSVLESAASKLRSAGRASAGPLGEAQLAIEEMKRRIPASRRR